MHATDSALRPLSLVQGVLSRADGSARFAFNADGQGGATECLCSVNGPIEVRLRDEKLDRATLEIGCLPVRGLAGPSYRALSHALTVILSPLLDLHAHPRSLVQITVQTTSLPSTRFAKPFRAFASVDALAESAPEEPLKRATEQACALNAATCALIDLGGSVGLKGLAFAVAVAVMLDDSIVLDPSAEQERDAAMTLVIGFSFGHSVGGDEGTMVWCETVAAGIKGRGITRETLDSAIELARQACQAIRAFVRQASEANLRGEAHATLTSTAARMDES